MSVVRRARTNRTYRYFTIEEINEQGLAIGDVVHGFEVVKYKYRGKGRETYVFKEEYSKLKLTYKVRYYVNERVSYRIKISGMPKENLLKLSNVGKLANFLHFYNY